MELLADLINKYAVIRDIKNLPELLTYLDGNEKENVDDAELFAESIEKTEIAWYNICVTSVQLHIEISISVGIT